VKIYSYREDLLSMYNSDLIASLLNKKSINPGVCVYQDSLVLSIR